MKSKRKVLLGCGLSIALGIGLVLATPFVEFPLYMSRLPREHWDDYRTWRHVSLPSDLDLMHPAPYSDELMVDVWRTIELFRAHPGEAEALAAITQPMPKKRTDYYEEDEMGEHGESEEVAPQQALAFPVAPEILTLAEGLAESFAELTQHPEFDLHALHSAHNVGMVPTLGLDGVSLHAFHSAMGAAHTILALRSIEEGDISSAASRLANLRRALVLDPYPDDYLYSVQRAITKNYVMNIATVLEASPDPVLAEMVLKELAGLQLPDRKGLAHLDHYEPVSRARYFLKRGLNAAFENGADMAYVADPLADPAMPYLRLELDRTRSIYPRVASEIEEYLSQYSDFETMNISSNFSFERASDWNNAPWYMRKIYMALMLPVQYEIQVMDPSNKMQHDTEGQNQVRANMQIDLLRIRAAVILFAAKNGTQPAGWSDLAPEYFPQPLADPFSKDASPYLLTPMPRSVGLDGDDDRGEVIETSPNSYEPDGDQILAFSETCVRDWREYQTQSAQSGASSPSR